MSLTKTEARALMQGDYIPRGTRVDPTGLTFRPTREDEVFRCTVQSSYDPQSGPIYCGRLADWVHVRDGGNVLPVCNRHKPRKAVFVA